MAEGISKITHEDDPERCQQMAAHGQCSNVSIPGSKYCKCHAGRGNASVAKESVRNYQLTRFKAQVARMTDSSAVKNLREELGILRVIMETHMNQCESDSDLILKSQVIGDLAMKIEKMVTSCNKLDTHLGQVLDKQALLNFASEIINIISEEVTDTDVVDAVATRIMESLSCSSK